MKVSANAIVVFLIGIALSTYVGLEHRSVVGFAVLVGLTIIATYFVNKMQKGD